MQELGLKGSEGEGESAAMDAWEAEMKAELEGALDLDSDKGHPRRQPLANPITPQAHKAATG